ncbi:hypothetical protein [Fulvivirga ligni]|uniref:hypothetical protein n=1 Tax=Fulvivirga ligni TaxID=2904246 RepID=UPI001F393D31|nr:hypothetical protein [Fulvivirga ligni]UII22574.1 hypothetical protein LVD16_04945 [Fulvivirga ligni]
MKTCNTKFFLTLFVLAISLFSCSKDDEPSDPKLSETNLFFMDEEIINLPTGLTQSDDPRANTLSFYMTYIGILSSYGSYFTVPEGASTSGPITASNGRLSDNTETYVYNYGGYIIANQITDQGSSYLYEVFVKIENEDYKKWYEASQKKDKSEATFTYLDPEEDERVELVSWTIKKNDNGYFIRYVTAEDEGVTEIQSNTDKSGTMVVIENGVKKYEYSWDSVGNGTWKEYNGQGNLIDEGGWTV